MGDTEEAVKSVEKQESMVGKILNIFGNKGGGTAAKVSKDTFDDQTARIQELELEIVDWENNFDGKVARELAKKVQELQDKYDAMEAEYTRLKNECQNFQTIQRGGRIYEDKILPLWTNIESRDPSNTGPLHVQVSIRSEKGVLWDGYDFQTGEYTVGTVRGYPGLIYSRSLVRQKNNKNIPVPLITKIGESGRIEFMIDDLSSTTTSTGVFSSVTTRNNPNALLYRNIQFKQLPSKVKSKYGLLESDGISVIFHYINEDNDEDGMEIMAFFVKAKK